MYSLTIAVELKSFSFAKLGGEFLNNGDLPASIEASELSMSIFWVVPLMPYTLRVTYAFEDVAVFDLGVFFSGRESDLGLGEFLGFFLDVFHFRRVDLELCQVVVRLQVERRKPDREVVGLLDDRSHLLHFDSVQRLDHQDV